MRSSCLCGAVRWTTDGEPFSLSHCHCGRCRKQHGTGFASYAMGTAASFALEGEGSIGTWASSPGMSRRFCRRCGSAVPIEPVSGIPFVMLPAGNFDEPTSIRPSLHIFVASKAPWDEIADALPRFDAFPPGIDVPANDDLERAAAPGSGLGGSCGCGAIAFTLTAAPFMSRHCHCSRCRKARSAAHATNVLTRASEIRWERGEENLTNYKIPEARFFTQTFCAQCGCKVPRVDPSRDLCITPMGSLDADPGIRPREHIFAGSKAEWFEIADALPQHAAGAPG